MNIQEPLSNEELSQVRKFWDYVEKETGLKYPIPEEQWKNIPSAIPFIKKLCGDRPFDPEYAAKQFLVLRKKW